MEKGMLKIQKIEVIEGDRGKYQRVTSDSGVYNFYGDFQLFEDRTYMCEMATAKTGNIYIRDAQEIEVQKINSPSSVSTSSLKDTNLMIARQVALKCAVEFLREKNTDEKSESIISLALEFEKHLIR